MKEEESSEPEDAVYAVCFSDPVKYNNILDVYDDLAIETINPQEPVNEKEMLTLLEKVMLDTTVTLDEP